MADKWKEKIRQQGKKLDATDKKAHEYKREAAGLRDEIETWKVRHEEALAEERMTKTMTQIKSIVWNNVVEDLPVIMNQLQFHLEFYIF